LEAEILQQFVANRVGGNRYNRYNQTGDGDRDKMEENQCPARGKECKNYGKQPNQPNVAQAHPIENFWGCLVQKVYEDRHGTAANSSH
jgi:hypothetical protein